MQFGNNRLKLSIVALLLFGQAAAAQWRQVEGIWGGDVSSFADNGSAIFSGTHGGGVFRSDDHGDNWVLASTGIMSADISVLATNGATVYAGVMGGSLFRSTNNGNEWMQCHKLMMQVTAMSVMNGAVFCADHHTVFCSTDNGATWMSVDTAKYATNITSLAVSGGFLIVGTQHGILRYSKSNTGWTLTDTVIVNAIVHTIIAAGDDLYAGINNGTVCRSTDNAATWIATDSMLSFPVYSLAKSGSYIIAGTHSGIFRSSDGGASWADVASGIPGNHRYVNTLSVIDGVLFSGFKYGGVQSSPDNGIRWTTRNNGINNVDIHSLTTVNGSIFAGTSCGVICRSDNRGVTWADVNSRFLGWTETFSPILGYDKNIFIGAHVSGYVFNSTDNAVTWTARDNGINAGPVTGFAKSGDILFAVNSSSWVFRSTNSGARWNLLTQLFWKDSLPVGINDLAVYRENLFAATLRDGVVYSADNGETWTDANDGLGDTCVNVLAVCGDALFAGSRNGVFKATGNGTPWQKCSGSTITAAVSSFAVYDNTLFAGTSGKGVFVSVNNVATQWKKVDGEPLENKQITAMAVLDDTFFAGTNDWGVWRRTLPEMIAMVPVQASKNTDRRIRGTLHVQCRTGYNVSISITLAHADRIRGTIVTVDGREVASINDRLADTGTSLVNTRLNAPGCYVVRVHIGEKTCMVRFLVAG